MKQPRILAFAGSARKDSFNKRLVKLAVEGAQSALAEVTLIDLADYPLPIFNEDLEAEGTPENATKLKQLLIDHDGFLISCPEYNSSITPLLKNVIDWCSRRTGGEPPLLAYKGKTCGLMAASPGRLGGLRGLAEVRSILSSIGVIVLPTQVAVPNASKVFEGETLTDPNKEAAVQGLGKELAEFTARVIAES